MPEKTIAGEMAFQKGCTRATRGSPNPCTGPQRLSESQDRGLEVPKLVNSYSWCLEWFLSTTLLVLHPLARYESVIRESTLSLDHAFSSRPQEK